MASIIILSVRRKSAHPPRSGSEIADTARVLAYPHFA
jgi:hypothetical protein